MQWSYRHDPNMEYGREMIPSSENYESSFVQHRGHGKSVSQNFGLIELFSLIMVIPSMIFIYEFFYLLVLPLIPISVIVFEMIREVMPLNQLLMYGGSFLAAYLFYRGLKYLFGSLSFSMGVFFLMALYGVAAWAVYFLLDYYPQNEALSNAMAEMNNFLIFIKSKI